MAGSRQAFICALLGSFLVLSILQSVRGEEEYFHRDFEEDLDEEELQYVTCGSAVQLVHRPGGYRLHSHNVQYGSGSQQQSVTGFPDTADTNNYFIVREAFGAKPCSQGDLIAKGSTIRLKHQNTGTWLHSHLHRSPLSGNQEVSCWSDENGGDTGDNWELLFKGEYWRRDTPLRLRHKDTGKFLHASMNVKFGNPIPGQLEVCASSKRSDENMWTVGEGIYWEANLPEGFGVNEDKDEL